MAAGAPPRRRGPSVGRVLAGIATLGGSEIFRAVSRIGERRPTERAATTLIAPVPRARAPVTAKGTKPVRGTSSAGISDVLQLEGVATDADVEALKSWVEDELEKDQTVLDSLRNLATENAGDVEEVQQALAKLAETLATLQAAAEEAEPEVRAAAARVGLFGGGSMGMMMMVLLLSGGLGTGTGTGLAGIDPTLLIIMMMMMGGMGDGAPGDMGGMMPLMMILLLV